jgi:DNA polymerase (family 10)
MPQLTNQQVAAQFTNIGNLLDIKGENRFKIQAYRKAADTISHLDTSLYHLWESGTDLTTLPGIGRAIADKIDELFTTGKLDFWERLTAEVPASLVDVLEIPDVGPALARAMWQELGLSTVAEVKAAAQAGRLRNLPRMGLKKETRIQSNIEAMEHRETDRFHLGIAWPLAQRILNTLRDVPDALHVEPIGSLRRGKETVGDIDFLVATENPEQVREAFIRFPDVAEITLAADTKAVVQYNNGMEGELFWVDPARWGTALVCTTGSKSHYAKLQALAEKQGYFLDFYALTRQSNREQILFDNEDALHKFLGLAPIPSYLREDRGEIEATQQNKLPALLSINDIKGQVHCHTTWSDGAHTVEEMARAALARGYQYLCITDHSRSLGIANGLSIERLWEQKEEIKTVQARVPGIRLWHGTEMEVKTDGSLDYPDDVLAELDFVVASIHTGLRQDRETLTRRALNAIRNPHVKVLAHPTGRLLTNRPGGDFDMDAIFQTAAETGTLLEINAAPERLDLNDEHVRQAISRGVKLVINSDAHHVDQFDNLKFGVATACRGWATKDDVANTLSLERFEESIMRGA